MTAGRETSTQHAAGKSGGRSIAGLAIVVGCLLLGGQVQVGAHLLIAAAAYAGWRMWRGEGKGGWAWALGIALGVALAAIEVVPLGAYLTRSPVWTDRTLEKVSAWSLERPRLLEAIGTAFPYAFGGQSRGLPNLARGLGVQNLNEAAGGFAGLATLIWLAPLGWRARREVPVAGFLGGLVVVGALGSFGIPPVANLLRALPVLDVTDNRRLGLWVAFGLVMLGGIGLDRLDRGGGRWWKVWVGGWAVGAVAFLLFAGAWWALAGPKLRQKALEHYAKAAAETPGADPAAYRDRAEAQARLARVFVPRYYGLGAAHLLALAALATALRLGRVPIASARAATMGLALADLLAFGVGLNPAIDRAMFRPESEVLAHLRRVAPPPLRGLAVGAELPPNLLMRYGLGDVRNYDSIELAASLEWFAPLYEPEKGRVERTSRRMITWAGVLRARDRLAAARVAAVVGAGPPPPGAFDRVEKVGAVWVARLDPADSPRRLAGDDPGRIAVEVPGGWPGGPLRVDETYAPGWRAEVDGRPAAVSADRGGWLAVAAPGGSRGAILTYDPAEVRVAGGVALAALAAVAGLMAAGGGGARGPKKARKQGWSASPDRVRIDP